MFRSMKNGNTVMTPKYWLLLTFLLCLQTLAEVGLRIPTCGIPICTIL